MVVGDASGVDRHRGDPRDPGVREDRAVVGSRLVGVAGVAADSRALQADALDFLGDAANYAISLGVAAMALVYLFMIFVDNVFARLKWQLAVRSAWTATLVLSAANLVLLALWK